MKREAFFATTSVFYRFFTEGLFDKTVAKILLLSLVLYGLGLVMVFDTSSAAVLDSDSTKNIYLPLFKQMTFGLVGMVVGFLTYRLGYARLLALSPTLLVIFSFLLLLVFVPGIGLAANGARRWISIMGVSMQPSEFVKYLIPLFFIHETHLKQTNLTLREFLKILGKIAVPMSLILIEPDNRTTIMIGGTLVVLFGLCAIPKRFWMTPLLLGAIAVALFASTVPYVAARLRVYANPELDLKGKGHQPYQAKIALGSGGMLGKGIGESMQKLSYLPEAQNDYIVAILGEEMGFLGVMGLMAGYMYFIYLGVKIALMSAERVGSFVAVAMTFLMGLQAFINFGVVSGLLPSTGLNLPLFSQGGSSLIVNFAAIGLILSVCTCQKKSSSL